MKAVLKILWKYRKQIIAGVQLAYRYAPRVYGFAKAKYRKIFKKQDIVEKIGIDVLKKDLTVLAKLSKSVDGALEDDKVSLTEGIGIGFKAVDMIGVFRNIKKAKNELADLDETERTELVDHFKAEFDLRNDQAEEVVETVLDLALQVALSMDVFSKLKVTE